MVLENRELTFLTFCFPKSLSTCVFWERGNCKEPPTPYTLNKTQGLSTLPPNSRKTCSRLPHLCVTTPDTDPENSHPLSQKWLTEPFVHPKLAQLRDKLFLLIWLTETPSNYKNNPSCKIILSLTYLLLPIKFKAKPACQNTLISILGWIPHCNILSNKSCSLVLGFAFNSEDMTASRSSVFTKHWSTIGPDRVKRLSRLRRWKHEAQVGTRVQDSRWS